MVDLAERTLERAILHEALRGATRTELWAAARTAWLFTTEDQFTTVIDELVSTAALAKTPRGWSTTRTGRERLARLEGD
jgi:hypothetical protein